MSSKDIIVVSGLGNGTGVGASTARLFASQLGYRVALVSRPRKEVDQLKKCINSAGPGSVRLLLSGVKCRSDCSLTPPGRNL